MVKAKACMEAGASQKRRTASAGKNGPDDGRGGGDRLLCICPLALLLDSKYQIFIFIFTNQVCDLQTMCACMSLVKGVSRQISLTP